MKIRIKFIALILSLAVLFICLCMPLSAVYSKANNYEQMYPELYSLKSDDEIYPTIILPGINHSKYYLADENGNVQTDKNSEPIESSLLLLNETSLYKNIISLLPNLLASLISQKDVGLSSKVSKKVSELMSYMQTDSNGNTVNNLITYKYNYPVSQMDDDTRNYFYKMLPVEPIADVVGEDKLYIYNFPLFGDPIESGKELNDFIETILEQTGAEKVNLASVSLGGTILTAYLNNSTTLSKINRIVNVVSLLKGTDIMADLIGRNFNLEDEFIYKDYFPMILSEIADSSNIGYFVNIMLRILPRSLFNSVLSAAYSAMHETLILNNPMFWAMVPKESYESLSEQYLSSSEKAQLKLKTDAFQQARLNLESNLLKAEKSGVKTFSICGYGLTYSDGDYNFFGIINSTKTANGDGIIPIASSSLGATSAKSGSELSEDYLSGKNSKYISPENSIDASSCLFPNRTWFFANQHHEIGKNDVAIRLAACIISGGVDDIDSTPLFPQFNQTRNTRSLVRSDNGYIFLAKSALEAGEASYSSNQLGNLQTAYDNCILMLNSTDCNEEAAEEACNSLISALVDMNLTELPKTKNKTEFSFLKVISDVLYALFKGNGYFEKLK